MHQLTWSAQTLSLFSNPYRRLNVMIDTISLTIYSTIISSCLALCAAYISFNLFKRNQKLDRDRLHYMQQAEKLLDENRRLTAPKPPLPRKTADEWEAKHKAERAEQRENQLRDVQRKDVTFLRQKILSGGELSMFYAALDITNQPLPKNPYPFYIFPQVSLGEIIRTSSPTKWHADEAFRAINSKRCDILAANTQGNPIAVFEYQGGGHYIGSDAGTRDAIKHIALERAGIHFVEIKNGTSRSEIGQIVRNIFDKELYDLSLNTLKKHKNAARAT